MVLSYLNLRVVPVQWPPISEAAMRGLPSGRARYGPIAPVAVNLACCADYPRDATYHFPDVRVRDFAFGHTGAGECTKGRKGGCRYLIGGALRYCNLRWAKNPACLLYECKHQMAV